MSPSTRIPSPRLTHDRNNGFDSTPAQGKQAIAEQIRDTWAETLEGVVETGNQLIVANSDEQITHVSIYRSVTPGEGNW
jgi:hypothetical protein